MGDVEILLNEEGQLKVVHHYDLRVVLRRVKIKGLERHCAVFWQNCIHRAFSCQNGSPRVSSQDASNMLLKGMFLGALSLAALRFSLELCYTNGASWLGCVTAPLWLLVFVGLWFIPLALFIGVIVVWAGDKAMPTMMKMMKMKKMKKTKWQRKEEVKTISALLQIPHVELKTTPL